jgi:hypothetical protein
MKPIMLLALFPLGGASVACLWAALLFFQMLDQVNSKKAPEDRIIYRFSWDALKVRTAYQRMYPEGALIRQERQCHILAILSVLLAFLIVLLVKH